MIDGTSETVEQVRACPAASDLLIGHALSYAARGFNVFPIKPNAKTPLTSHGLKDATTDAGTIAAWWSRWGDANIGVATGRASDLAVLDLDGPKGERSLTLLDGELVPTWTALTGNGAHLWFTFPDHELRNSAGKIGEGIDVRAEGGYVIAPPSVHPNGTAYKWIGARRKRAAWPDWLRPPQDEPLGATQSPRTYRPGVTGRPDRYAAAVLDHEAAAVRTAGVGTRNDALNRAAYAVARFVPASLSARSSVEELLAAAAAAGLPEAEARRTIASAFASRTSR